MSAQDIEEMAAQYETDRQAWERRAADRLAARVQAVNVANAYANSIQPGLAQLCEKFINTKIRNKDGSLAKKFKEQLDTLNLPHLTPLYVQRHCTEYSLSFRVTAHTSVGDENGSHTTTIPIGGISDGILTEINNYEPDRTDYTVAEVTRLREEYKEKRRAADAAYSALGIFGEHDM